MQRHSTPSLIDVAKRAGVSTATAGRALGDYGQVSARTRERVVLAAGELGYRANALARSMITGSTQLLGVVVPDVSNPFFASALRGITDTAQDADLEVLLANTDRDISVEERAVTIMEQKRVEGIVVATADPGRSTHLNRLHELGVPIVLLDRDIAGLRVDSVMVDHARAVDQAFTHLRELGHRRIGIVTEGVSTDVDTTAALLPSQQRLSAYVDAMRRADIDIEDDWVATTSYDHDEAHRAATLALRSTTPPTALICTDSVLAAGTFRAAQDLDMSMPDELSIIGFDDDAWTTLVRPELTVVSQPSHDLGTRAAERVIDKITKGRGGTDAVRLGTTLIRRNSTGPAA